MDDLTKMILLGLVVVVIICVIFGVMVVPYVLQPRVTPTTPPTPSQAGWYQVYFTTPKYPDKESDHHGSLDDKLTAFINTARTSVDMAIYQLDLPNVTQALIEAKQRVREIGWPGPPGCDAWHGRRRSARGKTGT
jgi:hypothetical protein